MEELILRAKAGDNSAIEEIFNDYKGMVRSIANKFFLVGGDRDDLLQEGGLGLHFAITNYDETKGSFPSFVRLCVLRQIIDAVNRDNSTKNRPLFSYEDISVAENMTDGITPESNLLQKEEDQIIEQIIVQKLSPLERQVINLFIQGYSYEDIMAKLNKTYKSVDGALQRAREKLLMYKE